MPRMKIRTQEDIEKKYSREHWELLSDLRKKAQKITEIFDAQGFGTLTFGSVARGDVKPSSDIDIILQQQIPTFRVELILEAAGIQIIQKKIVQATPNDIIKAHLLFEDNMSLVVLLTKFTKNPFEFYYFGGAITHQQLIHGDRVPGVDKQLLLIIPTPEGHRATSIIQQPQIAARTIGISVSIVEQRIRVLSRRDKIGRTGVFLNVEVPHDQNCEEKLRELSKSNFLLRRRMQM
jgi:predicted nucleotidyltransferase